MTATGYIAGTKSLAMVGHFIPLYKVQIAKVNLVLHEEVKRAVPYSWDPASLARCFAVACIPYSCILHPISLPLYNLSHIEK